MKLTWSNYYAVIIKKESKTLEEELKICKDELRFYWDEFHNPIEEDSFVDKLLEELKDEEIDVDETVIEEVFSDLLFRMTHIMPLKDCVKLYISWRDRFDFVRLNNAFFALTYPFVGVHGVPKLASLFSRLGLNPAYLLPSILYMRAAVRSALLLNPRSSGMLLRTALEVALKGLLYEHLKSYKFRGNVERKWDRFDSVVRFLDNVKKRSRDSNTAIEVILEAPEFYQVSSPSVKEISLWLDEWGVFHPIHNTVDIVNKLWREFSKEVHGDLSQLMKQDARTYQLDVYLKWITSLIDFVLLGILNTINNVTPKRLVNLSRPRENSKWQEFADWMKQGGLDRSEKRLRELVAWKGT